MHTHAVDPGLSKEIVLLLTLAAEATGIGLFIYSLKLRNPHNPLRLTWRVLEWQPLHRQRDHFVGNGFAFYKNGIQLFLLGVALHLASQLFLH